MYQHALLAVALQRGQEFSPHALAVGDAAVALAPGTGARLSALSAYESEDLDASGLPSTAPGRYRRA
jgi:hypothetical protein